MKSSRTSRWVSAFALIGLVLISLLMVLVLDASSLANPTIPLGPGNAGKQGPTGALVVRLFSNQNETDKLSLPTSSSNLPIGEWPVLVTTITNSSSPTSYTMVTDTRGGSQIDLPPGQYMVSFLDESLAVKLPVTVQVNVETKLVVTVDGAAYPLLYSEESGLQLTPNGVQSTMYLEVSSHSQVANVSEPVVIKAESTIPGSGHLVDATVLSSEVSGSGTQWLELATASPLNPVDANSIYLTTWIYYPQVTMTPIGLNGVSSDA